MTERYSIADVLPELDELRPGTNLAIVGPSMSGKEQLAFELLAAGYDEGDGILCITTRSAQRVIDDLERYLDALDPGRIGVVDCSGRDGQAVIEAMNEQVSSPGDLTGISIGTAKLHKQFHARGTTDIRYGLISISTLLRYLPPNKVFQFLHVYTNRVEETDSLGIYTLDNDSHDPQTVNTITSQFDGIVELRDTDSGETEIRVRGFGRRSTPWEPLD